MPGPVVERTAARDQRERGADALLPLPANVDLRRYRVIDVFAEDYDGNPGHSGRGILRGTLTS